MGAKKQIKRLEKRITRNSKEPDDYDENIYFDEKKVNLKILPFVDNYTVQSDIYVDIDEYPKILKIKVSDISDSVNLVFSIAYKTDIIKSFIEIRKTKNKIRFQYFLEFYNDNKKIKINFLLMWHRMMVELNKESFTEIPKLVDYQDDHVLTSAIKIYTNPSLILGDLIKADVKIIDAVIKKVNK